MMINNAEENRCTFPGGITYRPDGKSELDPCQYEVIEKHRNVTVEVLRCKKMRSCRDCMDATGRYRGHRR